MISFKLTATGIKEARIATAQVRSEINKAVEDKFQSWLEQYLVPRIRANTPILTGALRESIRVVDVQATARRIRASIVSTLPYALKMHEAEYHLGPVSSEQPDTPEGGVGNKYITRVVKYHADTLRAAMGAAPVGVLRKAYGSGAVRTISAETL